MLYYGYNNLIKFLQNHPQETNLCLKIEETRILNQIASNLMIKRMSRCWIHKSWISKEEREENESFYDIGGEG